MAKKTALANLFDTIEVKDPKTGEVVHVPISALHNNTANQILASRMRGLIDDHITKYREDEVKLTPKELRELAEAASSVADFSGKVYQGESNLPTDNERTVKPEALPETIDFSKLGQEAVKSTPVA